MLVLPQYAKRRWWGPLVRAIVLLTDLIMDVYGYWKAQIATWFNTKGEYQKLVDQLNTAPSADLWEEAANRLDTLCGNDLWRQNPVTRSYDYKLIALRFRQLIAARKRGRKDELAEIVRAGSLRNLASIGNQQLYNHAYAGTKLLIEDYIAEVIQCLEYLAQKSSSWTGAGETPANERQQRLTFFHDTRQSFGRSALILHGGSLFGLCHLGVVKGLLDAGLLPVVITGSAMGAVVTALVGSVPIDQLPEIIAAVPGALVPMWQEYNVSFTGSSSIAESIIKWRLPPEVLLFERYVSQHLGDMTFEEAYLVSGRILNIMVLPANSGSRLFNYLTTPKVLIRTAMLASIGTGYLPGVDKVQILVKDHLNRVVPLSNGEDTVFLPANRFSTNNARDSAYNRLSELFNVNNYIVSISRPYLAPLLQSDFVHRGNRDWLYRLLGLARLSGHYRIGQLAEWGLLPNIITQLFVDEIIPGGFQMNIVPQYEGVVTDCLLLLDSHDILRKVSRWIRIGERGVWPQLALIWARTAIELSLHVLLEGIEAET